MGILSVIPLVLLYILFMAWLVPWGRVQVLGTSQALPDGEMLVNYC